MTQLVVTPSIDSTMSQKDPDTNFGALGTIGCGILRAGGAKDDTNHAIANFDVSAIPLDAIISGAVMHRLITLADPSPHSIDIQRCTRPTQWTENGVTWNKYDGVTVWTSGGGDRDNTTPPTLTEVEPVAPGPYDVSGLGGFVRDALDNRNGIVSIIISNTDGDPPSTQRTKWLAQSFWTITIDYTLATAPVQEPGRRGSIRNQGGRPARPFPPAQAQRPVRPYAPTRSRGTHR